MSSASSTAAAPPAMSFQGVSKSFSQRTDSASGLDAGALEVLRDVAFDLPNAKVVAILGQSGSGKSTLLNIAAGLLAPDRGRVLVMGKDICAKPAAGSDTEVDWSRLGYMFQDDRLLPWRVALDNVALALEADSMPKSERRERARAALGLVGLADFASSYPHQLSGGMRSRIAMARSMVTQPDILLMDEPFSRLDAQTRGTMHSELLRIHAERGVSILFVTHDVDEAVILADKIVMMSPRPGRVYREIAVDLPQPRLGTPAAQALAAELRDMLGVMAGQIDHGAQGALPTPTQQEISA